MRCAAAPGAMLLQIKVSPLFRWTPALKASPIKRRQAIWTMEP
jgi:hypothetical protein